MISSISSGGDDDQVRLLRGDVAGGVHHDRVAAGQQGRGEGNQAGQRRKVFEGAWDAVRWGKC
jgi:hypothetical protein